MRRIKQFPKDKGLDHTISLLKEGYLFIGLAFLKEKA